jgi:hypothetical protein
MNTRWFEDPEVTDPVASECDGPFGLCIRTAGWIDRIRADVIAGRYRVDANAIARGLIERLLTESRSR